MNNSKKIKRPSERQVIEIARSNRKVGLEIIKLKEENKQNNKEIKKQSKKKRSNN